MSDLPTPRTDAEACPFNDLPSEPGDDWVTPAEFSRQLETELTLATERATKAEAEVESLREFKNRLLDALICNHIFTKEHETNPQKAIHNLIEWEIKIATDPKVNGGKVLVDESLMDDAISLRECLRRAGLDSLETADTVLKRMITQTVVAFDRKYPQPQKP